MSTTRTWEIPQNAAPRALTAWLDDSRRLAEATPAVDQADLWPVLGLTPPPGGRGALEVATAGRTDVGGALGTLVDACLWRLWKRIPAARITASDDPDAGIFADSLLRGGELADRVFPGPLDGLDDA